MCPQAAFMRFAEVLFVLLHEQRFVLARACFQKARRHTIQQALAGAVCNERSIYTLTEERRLATVGVPDQHAEKARPHFVLWLEWIEACVEVSASRPTSHSQYESERRLTGNATLLDKAAKLQRRMAKTWLHSAGPTHPRLRRQILQHQTPLCAKVETLAPKDHALSGRSPQAGTGLQRPRAT